VALPGLNGFVSEFLVLAGTFVSGQTSVVNGVSHPFGGNLGPAYAIPATTGVILGAVYLLYWAGRVVFGPLKEPAHDHGTEPHAPVKDLCLREWAVLVPMAVMVIYMGVRPGFVIDTIQPTVKYLAEQGTSQPPALVQSANPATPLTAKP
jgi:NADH-quinone oxidoreductase subunit M